MRRRKRNNMRSQNRSLKSSLWDIECNVLPSNSNYDLLCYDLLSGSHDVSSSAP